MSSGHSGTQHNEHIYKSTEGIYLVHDSSALSFSIKAFISLKSLKVIKVIKSGDQILSANVKTTTY